MDIGGSNGGSAAWDRTKLQVGSVASKVPIVYTNVQSTLSRNLETIPNGRAGGLKRFRTRESGSWRTEEELFTIPSPR